MNTTILRIALITAIRAIKDNIDRIEQLRFNHPENTAMQAKELECLYKWERSTHSASGFHPAKIGSMLIELEKEIEKYEKRQSQSRSMDSLTFTLELCAPMANIFNCKLEATE